jgi:hypothetical protein
LSTTSRMIFVNSLEFSPFTIMPSENKDVIISFFPIYFTLFHFLMYHIGNKHYVVKNSRQIFLHFSQSYDGIHYSYAWHIKEIKNCFLQHLQQFALLPTSKRITSFHANTCYYYLLHASKCQKISHHFLIWISLILMMTYALWSFVCLLW